MIYDNLLLAHDLVEKIRKTRRRKTWLVAYKVNMNKVYDKTYLGLHFDYAGRNEFLIKWCICTISYQILLNGSLGKIIFPQYSSRQGDPLSLSPYKCANSLSLALCSRQ